MRSAMPRPAAPLRTRGARAEGHTGRGREVGTSRPGSCSHDDAHADALARAVEELRVRPRRVCAADNDDDEDMPPTLEAVPASPDDSSPPSAHGFPLHEHSPPLTHDALARHDVAMGLKMTAGKSSHIGLDTAADAPAFVAVPCAPRELHEHFAPFPERGRRRKSRTLSLPRRSLTCPPSSTLRPHAAAMASAVRCTRVASLRTTDADSTSSRVPPLRNAQATPRTL